ncbi:MAG: UDP-glucose/GDP-mannose dehydrogenase family protein [Thermoplasmata archaeon]
MRVAVLGIGYVGLVTGATAALDGHRVICLDVADDKVEALRSGRAPFYEPGLEEAVRRMVSKKRLSASTDIEREVAASEMSFICVGTPSRRDGSADLRQVSEAARLIGTGLRDRKGYHVVVVKSTVPPDTTAGFVVPTVARYSGAQPGDFGACMCPEFLREGDALQDSLKPDRIVIGELDRRSGDNLLAFYSRKRCPKLRMWLTAAELVKYISNSFLATKIAFSNEMANLCEKFNVDVYEVMEGVGLDSRIGREFLRAGMGFGGSCFPKDLLALARVARKVGARSRIIEAVLRQNEEQPLRVVELAEEALGDLRGKAVAVLGLTFKPGTDDVRNSRAEPLIRALLARGARVIAHDPHGMENFKKEFGLNIEYAETALDALKGRDAVVFQTEWPEYRRIPASAYIRLMERPIVIDGRRTVEPRKLKLAGVRYFAIGAPRD